MDMLPFRGRASALDDRSRGFLTTVAWLGGHLSAEQAHQAHCTGGLLAEHPLAQLPAHRERLGQGSGSEAGGCENSAAARRHRDHLERLRRLGNGCEAADSAAAGGVRQRAGERSRRSEGGLSHREGLGRTYARICSVNLRDPYLTQVRFWDSLQATEKNGSSGRTRTYNPPVNSRFRGGGVHVFSMT